MIPSHELWKKIWRGVADPATLLTPKIATFEAEASLQHESYLAGPA